MSKLDALKQAKSLSDLAYILGEQPKVLSYVLYMIPSTLKYTPFLIPKKSGGTRTIQAPIDRLKRIQRALADLLQDIQEEISTKRKVDKRHAVSHGFKRKLSIITNARNHRNKTYVFNSDLENFFPSINFGRVYGFFVHNETFSLDPKVATVIAQIACHDNSLPQGSPCSPIISDYIGHILDMRLSRLASRHRCTYTRYVDDLSFSTSQPNFPKEIAYQHEGDHKWLAGDALVKNVFKTGFKLNHAKTRVQYKLSRQEATGLIVNRKVGVPTEFYHLTRAMCHSLFNQGFAFVVKDGIAQPVSDAVVRGRLSYIHHVRSMQNTLEKGPSLQGTAPFRLYQRYLNFKSFYGISQPVIIGEGVTDTIYLKAALNQLAGKFPNLIDVGHGTKEHKLTFFKYGKSSRELMGLSGGTGELKNLLGDYRKRISGFKFGGANPVIILVDNDDGAEKFFKTLGSMTKTKVTGTDPFYYVYANLYAVPIPPTGGPVAAIEGLFDPSLLNIPHEGKKLDLTNKETDGTKFYSKHTFAKSVVRPNQDKIDFTGFEPLLLAIEQVIADFAGRLAAGTAP
ncbi:retron Ec67 family RNA-directed DNA polymerase/endonuclease [Rhizobium sp. MHM7A]|uniref:retron Ec67 family RNA-directed DNA polymerase/endonuclease n=1 Tax=Rhizobium sp. MHM7A TaxID=2583233 RepID=UPI0011063BFF|nr:retron Ec67 family RNA-directed DNA polymerase/endonuclease [Rhizobium sp. MHM7A]TLX11759.1 RNA-directed DNA polymerase [Rhizobium sp. MHM7A]